MNDEQKSEGEQTAAPNGVPLINSGTSSEERCERQKQKRCAALKRWLKTGKDVAEAAAAIAVIYAALIYTGQLNASREANKADQSLRRPLVLAGNVEHKGFPDGDHLINQLFVNGGASPAKEVQADWTWSTDLPNSYHPNDWATQRSERIISQYIASGTLGIQGVIHLRPDERRTILVANRLYIFGITTYQSYIPGDNEMHVVHWCTELSHLTGNEDTFAWTFTSSCLRQNCIDEACGDDYRSRQPIPKVIPWWKRWL